MEIFTGQQKIIKTALGILAAVLVLFGGLAGDIARAEEKPAGEKIPAGARVLINLDENIVIETTVDESLRHTLQQYQSRMAGVGFGDEGARRAAEIQEQMMDGFYNRAVNDAGQKQAIGLGALNGELMIFGPSKSPTALVRNTDEERMEDDVMFMLSELMTQADDILSEKLRDRTYTALELAGTSMESEESYVAPRPSPASSLNTADDIILRMFGMTE